MTEPTAPRGGKSAGQFLSMGELLIDFIVADGAPTLLDAGLYSALPGGAPANVAVAVSRLGLPGAVLAVTGNDPFGERLIYALQAEGVDASRIRQDANQPTTLAFAWKDERGDGHFWLMRQADVCLNETDAANAGIPDLAALIVGSVSLANEPSRSAIHRAVRIAHEHGVPVCFDVNYRPSLWSDPAAFLPATRPILERATVVKLSAHDAVGLFGDEVTEPEDAISRIQAISPAPAVVLTDGERGCWYLDRQDDSIRHSPAFAVEAVEPTGAGDAFTAALVMRLAENSWAPPTADDIRVAAASGALATTRAGAWPGLPTRDELDLFLRGLEAVSEVERA